MWGRSIGKEICLGPMENGWRPISDLRAGHYAVGLPDDGYEIDIYRAGEWLLNVATGGRKLPASPSAGRC